MPSIDERYAPRLVGPYEDLRKDPLVQILCDDVLVTMPDGKMWGMSPNQASRLAQRLIRAAEFLEEGEDEKAI